MVLAASFYRIYNKHGLSGAEHESFSGLSFGRQPLAVLDESCNTYFDSHGGIALYLLGVLFCLIAIATICEEDFKNSIICLARGLKMPPDIAGATLMAAGTSSPELFASLVALGATSDDVGSGTIVGSVVFNTMIIIGGSAIFSPGPTLPLSPAVMYRDSFWNAVSITFLLTSFWDATIMWYEALVAVLLYGLYVVHMAYQKPFHAWLDVQSQKILARFRRSSPSHELSVEMRDEDDFHDNDDPLDESIASPFPQMRATSPAPIRNLQRPVVPSSIELPTFESNVENPYEQEENGVEEFNAEDEFEAVHPIPHPFTIRPKTVLQWVEAFFFFPWKIVFYYTIPNPQSERFKAMYAVSFTVCLIWLAFLTYMMIAFATKLGCLLNIDDAIMGATVLAVGTSMPDCLTSIAVAKDGQGDMAVSNALGSNIFDILVALGLPWLLEAAITAGRPVVVESNTIGIDSALCFLCLAIFLISVRFNKWKLNKTLGIIYCVIYALFLGYLIGYPLYIGSN